MGTDRERCAETAARSACRPRRATPAAGNRGPSLLVRRATGSWRHQTRARPASSSPAEANAGSVLGIRRCPARWRAPRRYPPGGCGLEPAPPGRPIRSCTVPLRTDATPRSLPARMADAETCVASCDGRKRRLGPALEAGAPRVRLPGAVYPALRAQIDRSNPKTKL